MGNFFLFPRTYLSRLVSGFWKVATIVFFVGLLNAAPARSQTNQQPIYFFIDGRSSVFDQCVLRGNWTGAREGYLTNTLPRTWELPEGSSSGIWWSGSVADSAAYAGATRRFGDQLRNVMDNNPGRPIVIVAHSWGSVIAYQVLRDIEAGRTAPLPWDVSILVTLGSPLESSIMDYAARWGVAACWPGQVVGQEYIIASNLPKPSVVKYWLNFYGGRDSISSPKKNAKNYGNPAASHSSYHSNESQAKQIYAIISGKDFRTCENRLRAGSEIPGNWGTPVNVFSRDRQLLFEAICNGDGDVQIRGGHNYADQWTLNYGFTWDGKKWNRFSFKGSNRQGIWFYGPVEANISAKEFVDTENNGNHLFVAYACVFFGEWRCGFRDNSGSAYLWQIQAFRFE